MRARAALALRGSSAEAEQHAPDLVRIQAECRSGELAGYGVVLTPALTGLDQAFDLRNGAIRWRLDGGAGPLPAPERQTFFARYARMQRTSRP